MNILDQPKKLQESSFREWLSHNLDEIVGNAWYMHECPIAKHMAEVCGSPVVVTGQRVYCLASDYREAMDLWSQRFIRSFDNTYPSGEQVTGRQVLAVLDESHRWWQQWEKENDSNRTTN